MSRDGEKFGTGQIEGVVAPETRRTRRAPPALLPMLTLGVPGSPTAGGAPGRPHDLGPAAGPLLFVEKADFVWGLIASMYLGNIAGLIVVLTCVPLFAAILRVPFSIIAPVILVICAIGAYTVHNSMFDVWLMLVFGVMGYIFKKLDYPLAPAGARAGARRPRGGLVPPVDADVPGRHAHLLFQPPRRLVHHAALVLLFWPLISRVIDVLRGRNGRAA
jgi:putative tricarboxylic transport membrane protein